MSERSVRLKYLLHRARNIRPGNLVEFAKQVQRVSKAPLPVIIADMLWCSVRYDMGFRDYAVWDIRLLKARERKTWMTHPKSHRLTKLYNDPASYHRFEDKITFYGEFADVIRREWIDARTATDAEVADFVARHGRVVAKPAAGEGGAGISVYTTDDVTDAAAFRARLIAADQTLVEQALEQHEAMAALYPDSVNTLRMITFYDPDADRMHLVAAVLRIGNGAAIDNFASGGMFTLLDERGVVLYPGVDKNSNVYATHPKTGTPIQGFQVPRYEEALALLEDVVRRIPEIRYVGWDIAMTPDGPAVIEGNHNSSVFQPKPSASGVRTGLLPVYKAAFGF
ncbi:sugar-transfer associated ATP-grasp domain-containing protein [Microbacterium sp.]|uniref:sugar-transfer associated ATP-grasp domain-containing protein n=1 Tax=Microbacterium sp. TaxID=51671 RepID=UPI003221846C